MRITRHAREHMTRRRVRGEHVELALGLGIEVHAANATFYVLRLKDIPPAMRPDAPRPRGAPR